MPYLRPTRSELISDVAADIAGANPGSDPLLRFSSLQITGKVQAGLAHLHYGYLDWIAKMAVPFTAEGEYLAGWGALRNTYQKAASLAQLSVTFPGSIGSSLDAGTPVTRGDGAEYTTNVAAVVDSTGYATTTITAAIAGAAANSGAGVVMTLGTSVTGIQSTGAVVSTVVTGSDIEDSDDFYDRVMAAFQKTPQGGAASDYEGWATDVPGVTRAWVIPNGFGAGTVVVYVMLDIANASYGGFPQGANGVSALESRATAAAGDQLTVANAIYPDQPVTALVYVVSPLKNVVPFTISGISSASATLQASINAAIDDVFFRLGSPKGGSAGTVPLSAIETAIGALSGTSGFVIQSPAANIVSAVGYLPTRGNVTYTT